MGQGDVAGGGAEAAEEDGERLFGERVGARDRGIPERAGLVRVPLAFAAEEAVDVDQAGPRYDPLDRGAAVAGGDEVGKLLLPGVERAEADMGGLGLDHV